MARQAFRSGKRGWCGYCIFWPDVLRSHTEHFGSSIRIGYKISILSDVMAICALIENIVTYVYITNL